MRTTRKSSLQIANLLAKLQNKAKNFKMDNPIDQIVKSAEGYYIIFSRKKIFKTINDDDIGIENIKDLVNNKINLTDANYFSQVQLNDVKNDISNIEIMGMNPEYDAITLVTDDQNNETIVGIKSGEMNNLTSSISDEDKQHIENVNNLFIDDGCVHLMNTNINNVSQIELEMMTKIVNSGNLNVTEQLSTDYSQNSKVTKPNVIAYNSITLEGDPIIYGDYTYKQYKLTDSKNENYYTIYQIENSNPKNVKEVYQSHTKRSFIDASGVTLVINEHVFTNNTLSSNEECFLIYPTGETKRSPIRLNNDMGAYGDYTYREYVIDALDYCYVVLGWKTSDPYNQYVVIRSNSWIVDLHWGSGHRLLCDNRRIGSNNTSYTTKAVHADGTLSNATVSQRNSFTYGSYTYRQYSITTNGKTEYAIFKIKTNDTTSFSNILTSDSWIYNYKITNVGMLICDNRKIKSNANYRPIIATEDGTISTATVSQRNSFTYGSYTYRQYSITANSKTEYAMYQINTSSTSTFSNILMSDSWIFNDNITNVGMIFTDNRRINANSTTYTTKVATTSGTISTATVSQRNSFTYGSYTYRQYSITANSKTEYAMYQINTSSTSTFSNILMSDSLLISKDISEYVLIYNSSMYSDLNIMRWYTKTSLMAIIYSDGSYSFDIPNDGTSTNNMYFDTVIHIGIIYGENHTAIFLTSSNSAASLNNTIRNIVLDGNYNNHFIGNRGLSLAVTGEHIPMIKDYKINKTYKDDTDVKSGQEPWYLLTSDVKMFNIHNLNDESDGRYKLYEHHYKSIAKSHFIELYNFLQSCTHTCYHAEMSIIHGDDYNGSNYYCYRHHIGNNTPKCDVEYDCVEKINCLVNGHYTIAKTT